MPVKLTGVKFVFSLLNRRLGISLVIDEIRFCVYSVKQKTEI